MKYFRKFFLRVYCKRAVLGDLTEYLAEILLFLVIIIGSLSLRSHFVEWANKKKVCKLEGSRLLPLCQELWSLG